MSIATALTWPRLPQARSRDRCSSCRIGPFPQVGDNGSLVTTLRSSLTPVLGARISSFHLARAPGLRRRQLNRFAARIAGFRV